MKILFTTHQGGLAGSTFSIAYLAKGLAAKGHEIHVGCPRDSLLSTELTQFTNVVCHAIPFSGYLDLSSAKVTARICKKFDIQIVCAQGGRDRNLTVAAKWIYRMKSDLVFVRRQRPRDEPWLKRLIHMKATRKIVMVSHGLRDIFIQKGYSEQHLHVIHNGIDANEFSKPAAKSEIDKVKKELGLRSERVIGCVSRLKYQKAIIQSLKYLPEDLVVLFVGINEGQLKKEIKKENPIQRLIFAGDVSRKELPAYYAVMGLSVLASEMDGFGLVIVESMLAGVPVVASKFGGIPDVIEDGKTGFLFDNSQPKDLASKVIALLDDTEMRDSITKEAKTRALDHFSIAATIDEYETLFQSLSRKN